MEKPERSVYTPQDFFQWRETGSLDLTPKFQRRGVWTAAARSFFIDTLLRQMPVPPIYIRVAQSDDRKRSLRQVIDGQQRISCILDYLDGKFRLSRTLPGSWAGKPFEGLTPDEQQQITTYTLSSELFYGISDSEVLQIFARLNTYSVPLNAQELRNGRYFGLFKQSVYDLAHEHLEFWRRHGIFSERSIARMLEVELTGELVIAEIDGMQDKKKSIEQFYGDYDDQYADRKKNESKFREVVDVVNETFGNSLNQTEFSRVPLFYSLFCAIYHYRYGLPKCELKTSRKEINKSQRLSLAEAVQRLSDLIEAGREGAPLSPNAEDFVNACLRQTDNIKPRNDRLRYLYERAFDE
jgi:Protein of unknown function DUF262